ncbi:hypothetical protein [Rhodanobacter panaciterrae]|uniref:hypothetical protein n=1 Tax=Rhodanobacter panaciterrae TaxID=490572 RepID=UPI00167650E1|nr:hypothetical protein [Rhodanobacter panaciterrae]
MSRTLRHLACSPRFRALAWLAWLILVVAPVHAAPGVMVMRSDAHQVGPARSAAHVVEHGQHAMSVDADCCGDQSHGRQGSANACHCTAVCGSALPVVAMVELAPMALAGVQLAARFAAPPGGVHAPLLRPPAG